MKRLLPLATLITLSLAGPAHALFDDDVARRQILDLRQEIQDLRERLETRTETSSRGQLDLANQNEQLRAEVAKLRGQLEVLLHEVESLKQRQRDFYVDLDNRMRKLETSPAPAAAAAPPPSDPGAESRDYEGALNLLKEGKHREALAGFEQFIKQHPRSSLLPGANLWAGNAAMQAKEVASANNYFKAVLNNWPDDPAAPDAMLGLANSQQAMGDPKSAQDTLKKLVERYPSSPAAKAARQRLGARP